MTALADAEARVAATAQHIRDLHGQLDAARREHLAALNARERIAHEAALRRHRERGDDTQLDLLDGDT